MLIKSEHQALEILDNERQDALYREAAARYLEQHPNERLIGRLVRALQDDDEGVRWAASHALADLAEAALPDLLKALMDPKRVGDPRLREGAYHVLRHWHDQAALAAPLLHELRSFVAADLGTLIEADHLFQKLQEREPGLVWPGSASQTVTPNAPRDAPEMRPTPSKAPGLNWPTDSGSTGAATIPYNAQVACANGVAGRTRYVVVDPIRSLVTYIVVADVEDPYAARLVPIDWVAQTMAKKIVLRGVVEDLTALRPFYATEYVQEATPLFAYRPEEFILWPYLIPTRSLANPSESHQLPEGQLAIRHSTLVRAIDGPVGRLDEFKISLPDGQITQLILRVGHWWDHKNVAIPGAHIDRFQRDRIFLDLERSAIAALPALQKYEDSELG